jgi:hypothetical protein
MLVIHSRAWTLPWKTTAGLPLPDEPQKWMPVMAPAAVRVARSNDRRAGRVRRLQVLQELEVVGVGVVRVEPRGVGRAS